MVQRHFINLHYTSKEDWWVCVENINAIRHNHDKEDPNDDGVWVYLVSDNLPIKVSESMEEIITLINSINQENL